MVVRPHSGLVSQEPVLFATTVRGNVEYGLRVLRSFSFVPYFLAELILPPPSIGTKHEHASSEEKMKLVREACVKANADAFISALPEGYNTVVGERGMLLCVYPRMQRFHQATD